MILKELDNIDSEHKRVALIFMNDFKKHFTNHEDFEISCAMPNGVLEVCISKDNRFSIDEIKYNSLLLHSNTKDLSDLPLLTVIYMVQKWALTFVKELN